LLGAFLQGGAQGVTGEGGSGLMELAGNGINGADQVIFQGDLHGSHGDRPENLGLIQR
jgi:hypothetical protein